MVVYLDLALLSNVLSLFYHELCANSTLLFAFGILCLLLGMYYFNFIAVREWLFFWISLDDFFPNDLHNERRHCEPYAFVNGAMHWVASVKYCCRQNFQLPMNMGSASIYGYVSIYGNSITYSYEKPYIGQDGHDSHHFILWVMKEYGVTSSWTQYFYWWWRIQKGHTKANMF